jgi:hypothetical protein
VDDDEEEWDDDKEEWDDDKEEWDDDEEEWDDAEEMADPDFNPDDYSRQEYDGWAEQSKAIYKPMLDVKAYTLRIELDYIKPAIWREWRFRPTSRYHPWPPSFSWPWVGMRTICISSLSVTAVHPPTTPHLSMRPHAT